MFSKYSLQVDFFFIDMLKLQMRNSRGNLGFHHLTNFFLFKHLIISVLVVFFFGKPGSKYRYY